MSNIKKGMLHNRNFHSNFSEAGVYHEPLMTLAELARFLNKNPSYIGQKFNLMRDIIKPVTCPSGKKYYKRSELVAWAKEKGWINENS